MEKLSKTTKNKYVITLHDDVLTAIESLKMRAEKVNLTYLLHLDPFINGALLEHFQAIDQQIKKAELERQYRNCENYYRYGTIDLQEIEKIKKRLQCYE